MDMERYIDSMWKRITIICVVILLLSMVVSQSITFPIMIMGIIVTLCGLVIVIGSAVLSVLSFCFSIISFATGDFDELKSLLIIFGVSFPTFLICCCVIHLLGLK